MGRAAGRAGEVMGRGAGRARWIVGRDAASNSGRAAACATLEGPAGPGRPAVPARTGRGSDLAAEVTTSRDSTCDRSQCGRRTGRCRRRGSARRTKTAVGRAQVWEMATDQLGTRTSRSTLLIAPGRRYREQGEDHLSGCDGERSWFAVRAGDGWTVEASGGPEPPLPSVLRPSWLLTGFTLEPIGPVISERAGGAAGCGDATARSPAGLGLASPAGPGGGRVDAGLGILLGRRRSSTARRSA